MADGLEISEELVQSLIAAQFPQWASMEVRPVVPGGWDNRTFRLGEDMAVRLPSAARYAAQVEKEHHWLPRLSAALTLEIPASLALGAPGEGFGWPWSVRRWIPGSTALDTPGADRVLLAQALGDFLFDLRRIPIDGAPAAGPHNFWRGGPLKVYAGEARAAIEILGERIDGPAAIEVLESALTTQWQAPPVWVHGDIAPANLILRAGALAAVIDFGCCAVGDPACDLAIAWSFFEDQSRSAFRAAAGVDDGTWIRARGWALWKAVILMAGHGAPAHDLRRASTVVETILEDFSASK